MDTTTLFIIVILAVLLAIILPFLIIRKKEHLSGERGERIVSQLLSSLRIESDELINNYIASRNKYNTASIQIDHILISHKGVFVIETKDFAGRIYGTREQNNWTQVLAYGEVKNKLYNPVMQNETHCRYIDKLLDRILPVFNVVIFVDADLSGVRGLDGIVFDLYSFKKWDRSLNNSSLMTDISIQSAKEILLGEMERMKISKEEHIQNIKRRH